MTLGQRHFHARWPTEMVKDFREAYGGQLGRRYPVRQVQEAVLAVHPILANWPKKDITCFDLMFWESEAVIGTMLRLMRKDVAVCLSVHDSIIVPLDASKCAAKILKHEYCRVIGVEPWLTMHSRNDL